MLPALLVLVLVAAPARAPEKIEPLPKLETPKIELDLPDLPKAEGIEAPARPETDETRTSPGGLRDATGLEARKLVPVRLESLVHARDFSRAGAGRTPVGRIDAFVLDGVPSTVGPFKSLLRLVSPERLPTTVRVRLLSPGGDELLASRADVSFGSAEVMELVIEWEGFRATSVGEYKLVVDLDGQSSEHPLPVRTR